MEHMSAHERGTPLLRKLSAIGPQNKWTARQSVRAVGRSSPLENKHFLHLSHVENLSHF
jgi:hypothetical protein